MSKKNYLFALILLVLSCAVKETVRIKEPIRIPAEFNIVLKEAEKTTPSTSEAQYHYGLGQYAYSNKDYKKAYQYFWQALRYDPKNSKIEEKLRSSISVLLSDDDKFLNLQILSQRFSLEIESLSIDYLLAIYSLLDGESSLIVDYLLRQVVENETQDEGIYEFLLYLLNAQEQYIKELTVAQMACKKFKGNPLFMNWYAYSIISNSEVSYYPYAKELLQKCLDITPNSIYYWDSLAWLYYNWGKNSLAYDIVQSRLFEFEDIDEVAYHVGKICLAMDKTQEALKYFTIVTEISDSSKFLELSKKEIIKLSEVEEE